MVIEFTHNDSEEFVEDVCACREYLAKIKDLVNEIEMMLGNLVFANSKIGEQQKRISFLEDRLVTIRSSINLTKYRRNDTIEKRKELKRFDFKARRKNKKELAEIDEILADLKASYSRAKEEIKNLSETILQKTAQKQYDALRKNMFLTIRDLSVVVKDYRLFRNEFVREYQMYIPEVNLCDIISTTPEGEIKVFPKEVPFVSTLYIPRPCLTTPEEIDGVEYEVEYF